MICNTKKVTSFIFMMLIANSLQKESEEGQSTNQSKWERAGWFALKTAAVSVVVIGGISVAVPALGFGAAGVGAGTVASAVQSSCLGGYIATGGTFATLQSIGAAGLAGTTKAAIVAATGSVMSYFTEEEKKEEEQK